MEKALSLSPMASGRRPGPQESPFSNPAPDGLKLKPKTRAPPSLSSQFPTGDLPGTDQVAFPMASTDEKKDAYSVWGLPPPDVSERIKKLMEGIRSEFGGPRFEPHVTVVGDIRLTESDARVKFRQACEGLKAYGAAVSKVATGPSFYQCVFLLLHPTPEVVEASDHCCRHFGYVRPSAYMPHLSLLYADITEEEKKRVEERAYALDDTIGNLDFPISRLALYKSDTQDKSLKSWAKVDELDLHQIS